MTRCEIEVQAQMTTMQQHMESLLQVVNESTTTAKRSHRTLDVKLVPISVKDDIEAYLVVLCDIVFYLYCILRLLHANLSRLQ